MNILMKLYIHDSFITFVDNNYKFIKPLFFFFFFFFFLAAPSAPSTTSTSSPLSSRFYHLNNCIYCKNILENL